MAPAGGEMKGHVLPVEKQFGFRVEVAQQLILPVPAQRKWSDDGRDGE